MKTPKKITKIEFFFVYNKNRPSHHTTSVMFSPRTFHPASAPTSPSTTSAKRFAGGPNTAGKSGPSYWRAALTLVSKGPRGRAERLECSLVSKVTPLQRVEESDEATASNEAPASNEPSISEVTCADGGGRCRGARIEDGCTCTP